MTTIRSTTKIITTIIEETTPEITTTITTTTDTPTIIMIPMRTMITMVTTRNTIIIT
jgi:hypothetical protein